MVAKACAAISLAAACPTGSTRSCATPADHDVEFVYGAVTEGPVTTGRFLAGVRLGVDCLIVSYQVRFGLEHHLLED
jgi:hypothetical protein